jgi:protocatechuate 3,4-dioxygenase beta subunit
MDRKLSRRSLIQCLSAAALWGAETDPAWRARVAAEKEPGERLIIRGRVLRNAGGPPAAGAVITVYQTDAAGIYGTQQGHPRDVARLRGRLTVGPEGQYEIVTIRPGPYPGGGVPAHIHVNLVEPGREPREIFEFLFAGDQYLRGGAQGYVLTLRKDAQGTWIATQDVALQR